MYFYENSIEFNSIKQKELNDIYSLKIFQNEQNFTIFAMNIRSLKKNFDFLTTELSVANIQIDIIILVETWGDGNKEHFFNIKGYKQLSHTNNNNIAGGIVIYIKETLFFTKEKNIFKTADALSIIIKK